MPTPSLSIVALPVPPFVRHALYAAGLSSLSDLDGLSEQALAEGDRDASCETCISL